MGPNGGLAALVEGHCVGVLLSHPFGANGNPLARVSPMRKAAQMPDLRRSLLLPLVMLYDLGATIIETGALPSIALAGERFGRIGGNEAFGRFGIGHHPGFYASGEMADHRWR